MENIKNDKIKNHIKITAAVLAIGWLLSSYVFGSLFHSDSTQDDRMFVVIIIIMAAIISNFIYYENYTEKK
jgi:hypothetical protein